MGARWDGLIGAVTQMGTGESGKPAKNPILNGLLAGSLNPSKVYQIRLTIQEGRTKL